MPMDEKMTKNQTDSLYARISKRIHSLEKENCSIWLAFNQADDLLDDSNNYKAGKARDKIARASVHIKKAIKALKKSKLVMHDFNVAGQRIIRVDQTGIWKGEHSYYKDADGELVASVVAQETYEGLWRLKINIMGVETIMSYEKGATPACEYVVKKLSKKGYHVISMTDVDTGIIYGSCGAGKIGYYRNNQSGLRGKIEAFKKGWDKPLRVDTVEAAEEFILKEVVKAREGESYNKKSQS